MKVHSALEFNEKGHEVKKGSLLEAAHIAELPSDSGLNEKSNFGADL